MYNNLHRKRTLLIKIQRNEWLSLTQFAKKEKIHKYIYPSISLFSPQKNFSTLQRNIWTSTIDLSINLSSVFHIQSIHVYDLPRHKQTH